MSEVIPPRATSRGLRAGWRALGPAGPLGVVVMTIPPLGGFVLIALVPYIAPYLRANPSAGSILYVLVGALLIGMALVPTYSTSILAGWAFGFLYGSAVAMLALTIAGLLAYGVARLAARERVLTFVRERAKWNVVYQALLNQSPARTLLIIILLRIPPLAPMAAANFMFGAVRVPLGIYLLGTVIGMIPRTLVVVFAASQLEQLAFENVEGRGLKIAGIVVSLVAIGIVGMMANRALKKATQGEQTIEK